MEHVIRHIGITLIVALALLTNVEAAPKTKPQNAVAFQNGSVLIDYPTEYGDRASPVWIALGLIDGRSDVGWSSRRSAPAPHNFLFELARPYLIEALSFDTVNTEWRTHEGISAERVAVLASTQGRKGPFEVVFEGSLKPNAVTHVPLSEPVQTRWLKLSVTENGGHSQYTELMEFQALGTPEAGERHVPLVASTYETNWNPFFLMIDNQEVHGCYDYDGGIFHGHYAGDFVKIEWREHGPQIGKAVLAITADGTHFNGFWYEDGVIQGSWHGRQSKDAAQPACADKLQERKENTIERELDETGRAVLYGIYFNYDSDVLKADSTAQLSKVRAWLSANSAQQVVFAGHTDSDGSEEYNADLSLRRAEAVVGWLVENNVNESRMSAVGLGEKRPVASNLTVHGKALNRRVEIVLPQ